MKRTLELSDYFTFMVILFRLLKDIYYIELIVFVSVTNGMRVCINSDR